MRTLSNSQYGLLFCAKHSTTPDTDKVPLPTQVMVATMWDGLSGQHRRSHTSVRAGAIMLG